MSKRSSKISTVIISRTDSIGDVMLTLPLAGIIKKFMPDVRIVFLGRDYTRAVIGCCDHIDEFVSWDLIKALPPQDQLRQFKGLHADAILHVFPDKSIAALAKQSLIPIRAGTSHRVYHLLTCNRLLHFSRKSSALHESQLNLKLLSAIGIDVMLSRTEINRFSGFTKIPSLNAEFKTLMSSDKFNLILHPRSKGSAREWGLENFSKLIDMLPADRFNVFISGTTEEGKSMQSFILENKKATDLTGKMNLEQYIAFIASAQGLIAASTGPLHIASALNKKAIGIFSPMHPIHPGRWAPIGEQAEFLVKNTNCSDCRNNNDCHCIREVSPEVVRDRLFLALES
jgi:ADP-heptose:LPS heptosyltransferase